MDSEAGQIHSVLFSGGFECRIVHRGFVVFRRLHRGFVYHHSVALCLVRSDFFCTACLKRVRTADPLITARVLA